MLGIGKVLSGGFWVRAGRGRVESEKEIGQVTKLMSARVRIRSGCSVLQLQHNITHNHNLKSCTSTSLNLSLNT